MSKRSVSLVKKRKRAMKGRNVVTRGGEPLSVLIQSNMYGVTLILNYRVGMGIFEKLVDRLEGIRHDAYAQIYIGVR